MIDSLTARGYPETKNKTSVKKIIGKWTGTTLKTQGKLKKVKVGQKKTKIEVLGKTKPLETYFKLLEDVGGYPEPIERFGEGVSEKESHGEN